MVSAVNPPIPPCQSEENRYRPQFPRSPAAANMVKGASVSAGTRWGVAWIWSSGTSGISSLIARRATAAPCCAKPPPPARIRRLWRQAFPGSVPIAGPDNSFTRDRFNAARESIFRVSFIAGGQVRVINCGHKRVSADIRATSHPVISGLDGLVTTREWGRRLNQAKLSTEAQLSAARHIPAAVHW
jgi:hypothetical protein